MCNVYCIGGSPCSGKSTIAGILSKKHKMQYYCFDDKMWEYIKIGANDGNKWLNYILTTSMDDMWLVNPEEMFHNAIKLCHELLPYVKDSIKGINDIILEGTAFIPAVIDKYEISKTNYICMVPSKIFQFEGYSKRLWIRDYLKKTSDPEKAYLNWMKRDMLLTEYMLNEATRLGLQTMIMDGTKDINENVDIVEKAIGLKPISF